MLLINGIFVGLLSAACWSFGIALHWENARRAIIILIIADTAWWTVKALGLLSSDEVREDVRMALATAILRSIRSYVAN